MVQVTLREEVAEQLRYVAEKWDTDLPGAIAKLVHNELQDESTDLTADQLKADQFYAALTQIGKEHEAFVSQHADLLPKYRGQYVAMRQGQVIDNDPDKNVLYRRIRSIYGNEPVLITLVDTEPIQTYYIRSPKLLRNGA